MVIVEVQAMTSVKKQSSTMTRKIIFDAFSHTTWVSTLMTEIGFRGNHPRILFANDSTEVEI
jgi:hypothetical protein